MRLDECHMKLKSHMDIGSITWEYSKAALSDAAMPDNANGAMQIGQIMTEKETEENRASAALRRPSRGDPEMC